MTETASISGASAQTSAKHKPVASAPTAADNPYLRGNFGPLSSELTHSELKVSGSLPKALNGRLLRQGPNPAGEIGPNHHWFLGHGMIHAIHIEDGRALSHRNRWVRTRPLERANGMRAAPDAVPGLPLDLGLSNTNVVGHAGKILSLGEVGLPYELDAELNTLREGNYEGRLLSNMTAHPKIDPKTGEMLFFGYDFGPTHLRYHVADAHGVLTKTLTIDTPRPTMMHDFGVTATRVVFMDLPVVFDIDMVARGAKMPFRWDDTHQARIGVMSRNTPEQTVTSREGDGSDIVWIDIAPCYVYHPLNAYDDGDSIVMDVVRHTRTFDQSLIGPEHEDAPTLHRWVINPKTRTVSDTLVSARGQEFPRVSPLVECYPHRYGYSVAALSEGSFDFGNLLKHDLVTGQTFEHFVGDGRHAGEGIFVPLNDRSADHGGEDEGWLLSVVYDERTNTSDVLVIDAQRFTEPPVATIHLPTRVPYGFHGNWISARSLAE